jgi:uncharacterized membrane protein (UPF0182 family)
VTTAPPPASRRRIALTITAVVIAVVVILFFVGAGFFTDVLWYDQLGYLPVLTTQWVAMVVMFLIGFVAMAVPVFLSIEIAFRARPVYAKLTAQLDRYQQVIEPLRRLATFGIPALLGLFGGVSAASRWPVVLQYFNRTPFGDSDPQFGLDTSFYVYELPFFRGVAAFASAVVLLSAIASIATTYLYGAIRVSGREVRISKSARIQLASIAALYIALQGVSIWLDQYSTVVSESQGILTTGAGYTEANASIPARAILAGIAIVVALLFVVTAVIGRWRLPVVGTALLLVSGLVVGSIYPFVVQRFQVDPNVSTLEAEYLQRNIDATRDAYGIDDVKTVQYDARTDAEAGALREDADTTANIRIIDPALVSASVAQLQRIRQYYSFPEHLDVDRYTVDGKTQDTVLSVRELNQRGLGDSQSWFSSTLVYTHGYGMVAAYGNQRTSDGQPEFLESDIPVTGALGEYEPRVYFGENSPAYSIVGAAEGSEAVELDYPAANSESEASSAKTTFSGDGGPSLDNLFTRLAYAVKFSSEQILLSSEVTDQSQILYDRDPLTRVKKVAPYLTLDSDPYPAVVDGRIMWIVDGYTTTADYPYSNTDSLGDAIADKYTEPSGLVLDNINYIRNSVKATVDAYDGSVTLYSWDDEDPLLKTWEKVYATEIKPASEMSDDLLAHVRYPADLFKVQRAILGAYHVTDPEEFRSGNDQWNTPNDPTGGTGTAATLQPPYYLTMQVPGTEAPAFTLYSTYVPRSSAAVANLTGYLAVNSDAGDGYGDLTLLELPKDETVPAPGQVQNSFNTDNDVAAELNILQRGDTTVTRGNLLTLPVGGGLLYVQPVYVQSTGETSYPLLRKILVAFGNDVAFENTLDEALDVIFEGDSGAQTGDEGVEPTDPTTDPTPEPTGTGAPTEEPTAEPTEEPAADDYEQALDDASAALQARQAALDAGDTVALAQAEQDLADAVERLVTLGG